MKIIHTADWHIGQYFYGYERREEHLVFFRWLEQVLLEREADALFVAGDIFDSPNPSAESQKIYYRFLREVSLRNPGLQIVIIAGNHDSAARLEASNPLLEDMNIHVKGLVQRKPEGEIDYSDLIIPLQKNGEIQAWCLAVPYLRQGDYPSSSTYREGVKKLYENLYAETEKIKSKNQALFVMGHLQAGGAEISENDRSERTVIGGLESISPEVFEKEDITYTALGHLHKAQKVNLQDNIRYAGSPLPMSFSEKNYRKGVYLIETKGNRLTNIERIPFEPPAKLLSLPAIPGSMEQVLNEISKLPEGEAGPFSAYLELKILLTEPEPSMRSRIEEALKTKAVRLATATPFLQKQKGRDRTITYEQLKALRPMEMAEDVFLQTYGNPMPDKMKALLQNIIAESER